MLTETTVRSDPICLDGILDNKFFVHSLISVSDEGNIAGKQALVNANFGDVESICSCQKADAVDVAIEYSISTASDMRAIGELGLCKGIVEEEARFSNQLWYQDDLRVIISLFLNAREAKLTLENQLVFQKPGLEHGQLEVPPESKHDGLVKSLTNQKSMAREIAARKSSSLTNCSAPLSPPCHAPAIITVEG
jgi:hypothetical protein